MTVEFVPPTMPKPYRVLLLGAATDAWYEATAEQQRRVLERFKRVTEQWVERGARVLATLDDDLFVVGAARDGRPTWYLMLEVDVLETVVEMLDRVRESVDGVHLDTYVRFEARVGRPFFLLE